VGARGTFGDQGVPSELGYGDWSPLDRGRAIGALWGWGRGPHDTVQIELVYYNDHTQNLF
jgi:hypothetical protein